MKKQTQRALSLASLAVLTLASAERSLAQTDLFWVGGSGNWITPNDWALSSGGAGQPTFPNSTLFNAVIDQAGSDVLLTSSQSINQLSITDASASLTISGVPGGNITLSCANSVTNTGSITLASSGNGLAQLFITTGGLQNSGTFTFGDGGGSTVVRYLDADLNNTGTVNVVTGVDAVLSRTGGVSVNSGQFNVATGGSLRFSGSSVFTQAAGKLDNQGAFTLSSGTFNFNGGSTSGNDIALVNSALVVGASSTGVGGFSFTGTSNTLAGNISAGQRVTVQGLPGGNATTTAQASFSNAGQIVLITSGNGYSQLYDPDATHVLSNGGVVDLKSGGAIPTRYLSMSTTNSGTINVEDSVDAQLNLTAGKYINNGQFNVAATGGVLLPNGQTFTQGGGTLNNLGSFRMSSGTFIFNGGTITGNDPVLNNSALQIGVGSTGVGAVSLINSGSTISGDIAAAQRVTVQGLPGGNATTTAHASFSNAGQIVLITSGNGYSQLYDPDATHVLSNSGVVDLKSGGAIPTRYLSMSTTNSGTINVEDSVDAQLNLAAGKYINNGQFNVAATGGVLLPNGQTFTQGGGTLNNLGSFRMSSGTFIFNGGTITGNDPVLSSSALQHSNGANGTGRVSLIGSGTTIAGNIAPAEVVTILGTSGLNTAASAAASFTNAGKLILDSNANGASAFSMPEGTTLTNTGQLRFKNTAGTNPSRVFASSLTNSGGDVLADGSLGTVLFNQNNAVILNAGSFIVQAGTTLQVAGAGARTFTNQPTGLLGGDGTLDVSLASVTFLNQGVISPGQSPGIFTILGNLPDAPTASLKIELAGLTQGLSYDLLSVRGNVTLDGTLDVSLLSGFMPSAADTFTVLATFGGTVAPNGIAGTFSNTPGGVLTSPAGTFDVTYNTTSVVLSNFSPTVPEPSFLAVSVVAATLVGRRRR